MAGFNSIRRGSMGVYYRTTINGFKFGMPIHVINCKMPKKNRGRISIDKMFGGN